MNVVKAKLRLVYPLQSNTVTVYRRLDGSQGRYGNFRENYTTVGFEPQNFRSVRSLYSDDAIPAATIY